MPAVATFGSIRVPALPTAWIDVDDEFNPDVPAEKDAQPAVYETTQREVVLPKLPADNGVTVKSETAPVNGHASANGHSALPKAGNVGEAYKVPENADIKVLQMQLGEKLAEARAIIEHMRHKTGLHLVLDRNLRLQVAL